MWKSDRLVFRPPTGHPVPFLPSPSSKSLSARCWPVRYPFLAVPPPSLLRSCLAIPPGWLLATATGCALSRGLRSAIAQHRSPNHDLNPFPLHYFTPPPRLSSCLDSNPPSPPRVACLPPWSSTSCHWQSTTPLRQPAHQWMPSSPLWSSVPVATTAPPYDPLRRAISPTPLAVREDASQTYCA